MIDAISNAVTGLFDLLLLPFGRHAGVALAAASLMCGAGVMALFKATSNQADLGRTRRRFQARILEIRIYPHDPMLILKALGGALVDSLTMELVDGRSLDRDVTPGGFPVPRVIGLGIALADALTGGRQAQAILR